MKNIPSWCGTSCLRLHGTEWQTLGDLELVCNDKTDDNGNAMLQSFIPRTDHYIDNVDPFLGPIW